MNLRKIWFKVFGEFEVGDLIKPSPLFILNHEHDEFWVWKNRMHEVWIKIPSDKFIGRVTKIEKHPSGETYLYLVWCADRRKPSPHVSCFVWDKRLAELV